MSRRTFGKSVPIGIVLGFYGIGRARARVAAKAFGAKRSDLAGFSFRARARFLPIWRVFLRV
jgi:hypothetical protein